MSALPGGVKSREQLLQAARALGLLDGLSPTLALWQLVDGNTAAISALVRRVYPTPTRLMDDDAPAAALDQWFQERRAPETASKARALFLELAERAGLPADRYAERLPREKRRAVGVPTPSAGPQRAPELDATRARYAQWLMEQLEQVGQGPAAADLMDRLERALDIHP